MEAQGTSQDKLLLNHCVNGQAQPLVQRGFVIHYFENFAGPFQMVMYILFRRPRLREDC